MNTVEVDEQALAAEAEAAVAAAEQPAAGQGGAMAEGAPVDVEEPESWGPLVDGLMVPVYLVVLPQWGLTPEEKTMLQTSLAESLDLLFPGGLAGKYAPLVRLFGACSGIVLGRYVAHGKLPPLGPRRVLEKTEAAAGTAASAEPAN